MTEFLIYQGKAAIALAVFYMFYRLLLSKETFHRFNRIVLLGTAALSFVLPLCVITLKKVVVVPAMTGTSETIVGEVAETVAMVPEASAPILPVILCSLFALGALAVLIHVVISIIGIRRMIRSGNFYDTDLNNTTAGVSMTYSEPLGKRWAVEIGTDLSYRFYRGYADGFGLPEWRWNMSVSKSIKSVTLGLKVADILNQTRNMRSTVSAEYVEDTYSNILGRFFLFSVSFNFGKMNAKKNKNIEGAMWDMM